MDTVKYCPECQEPIVGRRDKTFCSSSCKSKDFRRKAEQETIHSHRMISTPSVMPTAGHTPVPVVATEDDQDEADEWWEKQQRQREQEKRAQDVREQANALHRAYCQLVETFLEAEGRMIKEEALRDFLDELTEVTHDYRQHPGLAYTEDHSHQRLADLYWIRDTLRETLEGITHLGYFATKAGRFDIGKKRRNRLRNNLLA